MNENIIYESPKMKFIYFSENDIFCTDTGDSGDWTTDVGGGDSSAPDD